MEDKFKQLGVDRDIENILKELNIAEPTEIQEQTIPLAIEKKDIIAGSATGSGKTFAFAIPIIQNTEIKRGIQALILVPTRELAEQVSKEVKKLTKERKLNVISVYGGVSILPQIKNLKTAEIVIGTPGRILDHLERQTMDLVDLKTLILDEADRMLDMGFLKDVEKIIRQCPIKRQTMLFSATVSNEISKLAQKYMKSPCRISAEEYVDPSKLSQTYYDVLSASKFSLLVHLLKQEKSNLVMIFCNTRTNADFVAKNLKLEGLRTLAIHGGFSQDKRTKTMEQFHKQNIDVLICTDVAARGLHIPNVSHIYNYDIPKDPKEYIHRIGRTARAGKEGKVINILTGRDHENFRKILEKNKLNIKNIPTPEIKTIKIKWIIEEDKNFRGHSHNKRTLGKRDNFRNQQNRKNSGNRGRDSRTHKPHSRNQDYSSHKKQDSKR